MGAASSKLKGHHPDGRALVSASCRSVRARSLWAIVWASSSCSLDFSIAGRQFACPPEMADCRECNSDGTCRTARSIGPVDHGPPELEVPPEPAGTLDGGLARDAGSPPAPSVPDASIVEPMPALSDDCDEFRSRANDSICLDGDEQCFILGDVLSPALTAWLDPTTLPRDGSRAWCDRSGKGHHVLLPPEAERARVEQDNRVVGEALARSLTLDGGGLSLAEGSEPVLRPGNFAILTAAATPLEASDHQQFDLFESGEQSRISLSIVADGDGVAMGRISSLETALVPDPVVTRSLVYDGGFHLYSLYRRSEVRVLDDVIQLRLNSVLEFRSSSIAIPRALDLSSSRPPRIGRSAQSLPAAGRGRIAAIIVLRGSVPEDELTRLEYFLCKSLAVCTAPGPRLDSQTPPEPDPSVTEPPVTEAPVTEAPEPDPVPVHSDGGL